MTVSAYSYGTVALVQARIGWVVPEHADFGKTTTPSLSQVEDVLNQIAAEIHVKMMEAGYPADTKAAITISAPRAVPWLERLNVAGACADLLQGFPVANDEEGGSSPEKTWRKIYENGLKLISGIALEKMGLTKAASTTGQMVCTSVYDSNGDKKDPLFKREMFSPMNVEVEDE